MKVLVLLLLVLLPLKADNIISNEYYPDGSEMVLIAPLGILPSGGFLPVRVELKNESAGERSWNISSTANADNYGYYSGGMERGLNLITANFTVSCPSRASRTVELLVPIPQRLYPWSSDRSVSFMIADEDQKNFFDSFDKETLSVTNLAMSKDLWERFESEIVPVLIGANRSSRSRGRRASRIGTSHSNTGMVGGIDPKKLPSDWRAYAGYDALILSREDYLSLEPGAKAAIEKWISGGGFLIVLKNGENVLLPDFDEKTATKGFGVKTTLQCGENYDLFDAGKLKTIINLIPEPLTEKATKNYRTNLWKAGEELGTRSLGTTFILLALVIFAIIVGPVNLFFWANKNHRQRLIWTTPLISLIASVLMVAFIMLKDGFGGDGVRAIAIDVGGPGDNTAAIIQEQFSRTGILLDSDFSFDKNTIFTAVPAPETDFNRGGSSASYGVFSAEIQPSDDGWSVEGNFFQSRAERAQVLRSVIPSRERLELLPSTQDAPQLVSSFSYPLTDIFYHDPDDQIWIAPAIEPGATVTMTRSTASERNSRLKPTVERFGEGHRKTLKAVMTRPGCFAALSEKAPALETQTSIDWKNSPALITGRLIK